MNYESIFTAQKIINKLNQDERNTLLELLVLDDKIDVTLVVSTHVKRLEQFKLDATRDIHMLSQAGIDLGENTIKNIYKIKSDQKRIVALAQAKTLIAGGGYKGTIYGDKIEKMLDTSILDDDSWYERSWALKTK